MQATQTNLYRWTLLLTFEGGHRYFRNDVNNRVSACDDSGVLPHETDDGPIWLDPKRPILIEDIEHGDRSHGSHALVPVIVGWTGDTSNTFERVEHALTVARLFGLRVKITGSAAEFVSNLFAAMGAGVEIKIGGES